MRIRAARRIHLDKEFNFGERQDSSRSYRSTHQALALNHFVWSGFSDFLFNTRHPGWGNLPGISAVQGRAFFEPDPTAAYYSLVAK